MIAEFTHMLTEDERHTLLFLTGGLKVFKTEDLDTESRWNVNEYFGYNHRPNRKILKVIVKRDCVITKELIQDKC